MWLVFNCDASDTPVGKERSFTEGWKKLKSRLRDTEGQLFQVAPIPTPAIPPVRGVEGAVGLCLGLSGKIC